ncbi:MAG: pentapeptide repeat-containing protein, partial [Clostridiales bacterium]|nr:pentapeptide repeat-containing protein [Clostridiales bacterium]
MGNPEHMNIILNSTVVEWNEWRNNNTRIRPDLTRIDLSNRDLSGIDFRGVGLFKAKFNNSLLINANLRQSIAIKADFSGCNLTGSQV